MTPDRDFYTRQPFKLPKRVDGQPQKAPVDIEALDRELLGLYMAENEIPERIAAAFLAFDLEPPTRQSIDGNGFTMRQSKVLDATAFDSKPGFWDEEEDS